MVDITSFEHLSGEPSWLRGVAALRNRLPHAAFALCFGFTIALVLGFI